MRKGRCWAQCLQTARELCTPCTRPALCVCSWMFICILSDKAVNISKMLLWVLWMFWQIQQTQEGVFSKVSSVPSGSEAHVPTWVCNWCLRCACSEAVWWDMMPSLDSVRIVPYCGTACWGGELPGVWGDPSTFWGPAVSEVKCYVWVVKETYRKETQRLKIHRMERLFFSHSREGQ